MEPIIKAGWTCNYRMYDPDYTGDTIIFDRSIRECGFRCPAGDCDIYKRKNNQSQNCDARPVIVLDAETARKLADSLRIIINIGRAGNILGLNWDAITFTKALNISQKILAALGETK